MKSKHFPEVNLSIAKDQPQYQTLPVYANQETGSITFGYDLNHGDIQQILKEKTIWVELLTFGRPMQPIKVMLSKPKIGDQDLAEDDYDRGVELGGYKFNRFAPDDIKMQEYKLQSIGTTDTPRMILLVKHDESDNDVKFYFSAMEIVSSIDAAICSAYEALTVRPVLDGIAYHDGIRHMDYCSSEGGYDYCVDMDLMIKLFEELKRIELSHTSKTYAV